ncbi:hypothetical protein TcWFU_001295 [Taenia crassiceps]|uniref:Uncharacterized protein n=1 Tax=Taenia crassiceps TaxID=6207 RepID=A0ABR4QNP1_9CEST
MRGDKTAKKEHNPVTWVSIAQSIRQARGSTFTQSFPRHSSLLQLHLLSPPPFHPPPPPPPSTIGSCHLLPLDSSLLVASSPDISPPTCTSCHAIPSSLLASPIPSFRCGLYTPPLPPPPPPHVILCLIQRTYHHPYQSIHSLHLCVYGRHGRDSHFYHFFLGRLTGGLDSILESSLPSALFHRLSLGEDEADVGG